MNLKSIPSQRQIRFGEVIRSIISEFFIRGDIFNTEIDMSTITVSFVKMSKDLRVASVYFMPLGGKNKDQILQLLRRAELNLSRIDYHSDDLRKPESKDMIRKIFKWIEKFEDVE